jgi:hypothetical protein
VKPPSQISLKVHELNLDLFSVLVSVFGLVFSADPLNLNVGLISGSSEMPAIHIPGLSIKEDSGVVVIDSSYVGVSIEEVILISSKVMNSSIKPEKFNENETISASLDYQTGGLSSKMKKPVALNLGRLEAKLPGSQGSVIELNEARLLVDSEIDFQVRLAEVPQVLKVHDFRLKDQKVLEVSISEIDAKLNEDIIKEFVGTIACFYRETLLTASKSPKEKKTVNLSFEHISVYGHYIDDFKILITVDKFSATINPKSFSLFFLNSNIFDLETSKHHIVSTTICKVDKDYNEGTANIHVFGEEIVINLPRKYYLARAVLKFLRGSHKIFKWCKFSFNQTHRSQTYIAEKAKLELKFKDFKFLAEDDPIDHLQLKKRNVDPDQDVVLQLKALRLVNSLLTLTCKSAFVKLNNFELDNMEKLRTALEEIDEFDMPYDEFFAVILAYDFTCLGRKVVISIRDYPYQFCKIASVKFGGRSILTKNRIFAPIWAQYKHHSNIEVSCKDVTVVLGICLLKVMMDLLKIFKFVFLLRSNSERQIRKLDLIEFFKYFLHGFMNVSITSLRTIILRTASPYIFEFFNFDIAACQVVAKGSSSKIDCKDLLFYKGETLIMSIPSTSLILEYDLNCKTRNHWIVSNNLLEKIEDLTVDSLNLQVQISILQQEKPFSVYYHLIDSSIIDDFLSLCTNPPVFLIPVRSKSPGHFFQKFSKIELKELKIYNLEVFIILNSEENLAESLASCLKVPSVHLSAECVLQLENPLVPFMVRSAHGSCSNTLIVDCSEKKKMLMKCFIMEYSYSVNENHFVNVEGLEVAICHFFIRMVRDLVSNQPENMKKFIQKKRKEKKERKKLGIKKKKMTSKVILTGTISKPVISVINEEEISRILLKGGSSKFEIIEESLKFDTGHKDTKKKVNFFISVIECILDKLAESLALSNIFNSKDMSICLTLFSLPFNHFDLARNCQATDEFFWYKEKRLNRVDFRFPEMSSSIESEDFWALMDIIKAYIGIIPDKNISYSERLMEDEFKIHGGRELVRTFNENMKKSVNKKASESTNLSFTLDDLKVVLKNSVNSIIDLKIEGFHFEISSFSDNSCQKFLEIHKILMNSGNTLMISPLLLNNDEYLSSSKMVTLRILDRWIQGKEVNWPIIDHLEFFLYPLNINFSKDIYKELYSYFFNEDKETIEKRGRKIGLPRLYKYVHLNEFKICITVTGWIPLKQSKITLKSFTRQNKFKNLKGIFDKIMKRELKSMISQIPSICIQNIGISKKNFLPSTEVPQRSNSFFDKLKRNKTEKNMNNSDIQKKEGIKLMFGKDFK